MLELVQENLHKYRKELDEWFSKKYSEINLPIYASVDLRYSEWKVSVVDANYFPAGFNNVSEKHTLELSKLFEEKLFSKYPDASHVHILPESHTRNLGYIENILRIKKIVEKTGCKVTIGSPELNKYGLLGGISEDISLDTVLVNKENMMEVDGEIPDVILLNNDLTNGVIPGLSGVVEPPVEMGWQNRRKSNHYMYLEKLVSEASEILQIDPWILMPMWKVCEEKCLEFENCKEKLANDIDELIDKITEKYEHYGIKSEPVVFVKNDRGTYGLGIISVRKGDEIKKLSKRKIKRLTYGKGGTSAENFLIQEGVPTSLIHESSVLEPVGYTIGGKKLFWFFRGNNKKSVIENLNSPSSKYIQLEHINSELKDSINFELFELVSKLSFLAMGEEN
jgi:glutamate--cysteine ligase